ncbi:hypothetical protein LCGC14_2459470 [marine sediment metagenome]|uniref:Uncharacterized protein n=1 Tax=marine sediment metagenome TaxID=412755 RepID=A0A0F9C1C9_9ZZZZ
MTIHKVSTKTWDDVPVDVTIKGDEVHCYVPISFQGTTDQSLKDFEKVFGPRSWSGHYNPNDLGLSAARHVFTFLNII